MAVGTLIPVEEYLATDYQDGDREYVDGSLVERTVGEVGHSNLQTKFAVYLALHYPAHWVGVDARVQVKAQRFRIPDVVVVSGGMPSGAVITEPPHIVVEVLSKDDRIVDLEEKVQDYLDVGILNIWVLNPMTKSASIHTRSGVQYARDGFLRAQDPEISVQLAEVFC